MPYGTKRRIGARTTYRRNYRRVASRVARKKVVRTRRALPYRAKKPSTTALARRALNVALYNHKALRGSYQTNLHYMTRPVQPRLSYPACFHVVTPRQGETIWEWSQTAPGPPATYAVAAASTFAPPTEQNLTTGGPPGSTPRPQSNMWAEANDDVLNGKYYLQTMNLTFTAWARESMTTAVRYRIDFVRPNLRRNFRNYTAGGGLDAVNFKLPECLGSFNGLLGHVNRVNPMYFDFVRPPVFFTVAKTGDGDSKYTRKHVKLNINCLYNPRDIGTTAVDNSSPYLSIPG
ncbi:MAG TPA: hypothetical protein EYN66_18780, partial [Myxococcales bacterium]|nr:hypothetical protein [Myxococcales bacterium]